MWPSANIDALRAICFSWPRDPKNIIRICVLLMTVDSWWFFDLQGTHMLNPFIVQKTNWSSAYTAACAARDAWPLRIYYVISKLQWMTPNTHPSISMKHIFGCLYTCQSDRSSLDRSSCIKWGSNWTSLFSDRIRRFLDMFSQSGNIRGKSRLLWFNRPKLKNHSARDANGRLIRHNKAQQTIPQRLLPSESVCSRRTWPNLSSVASSIRNFSNVNTRNASKVLPRLSTWCGTVYLLIKRALHSYIMPLKHARPAQWIYWSRTSLKAEVISTLKTLLPASAAFIGCCVPISIGNSFTRELTNFPWTRHIDWRIRCRDCFAIFMPCGSPGCDKEFTRAVDHLHHLETIHQIRNQELLSKWNFSSHLRIQKTPNMERSKQGAEEYTLFRVLYISKDLAASPADVLSISRDACGESETAHSKRE